MAKIKILSTKKLDPSLAELAKEKGMELTEKESINIRYRTDEKTKQEIIQALAGENNTLIFTSANAVIAIGSLWNEHGAKGNRKIFSISGKTRTALLNYCSEEEILATADSGATLSDKILQHDTGKLVFFCGNIRRDELPAKLEEAGRQLQEIVVYDTIRTPEVIKEQYDAVLFFSPSAVESFFSANQLKPETVCFAIGQTTAESLRSFTEKIEISEAQTQEALLTSVEIYFRN